MPSSPFVGLWTINNWSPDSEIVAHGIPRDGFQVPGLLEISLEPASIPESFRLHWLTQSGQFSFVSNLQPAPQFPVPTLIGENLPVSFGTSTVACDLVLSLSDQILNGSIGVAGSTASGRRAPDTGSGTFTASANGGGSGVARKP